MIIIREKLFFPKKCVLITMVKLEINNVITDSGKDLQLMLKPLNERLFNTRIFTRSQRAIL